MKPVIHILIVMSVVLTLASSGRGYVEKEVDPFDMALEEIGLSKETLTFDYGDMSNYGGDKYVLPLFYTMHSSPFRVEHYCKVFRDDLLDNCESVAWLAAFGSSRIGEGVRRGLIGNPLDWIKPLADREHSLYMAIRDLQEFHGTSITSHSGARLQREASRVPPEVQALAAMIILATIDSLQYHDLAFERAALEFDLGDMYVRAKALATDEDVVDHGMERFIDLVDFKYLYTPSQDIGMAVDYVADSLASLQPADDFTFECRTALGKIVLSMAPAPISMRRTTTFSSSMWAGMTLTAGEPRTATRRTGSRFSSTPPGMTSTKSNQGMSRDSEPEFSGMRILWTSPGRIST